MSESPSLPVDNSAEDITAVLRWIFVVAVIFAGIAFLMGFFARTMPVQSPIQTPIVEAAYASPDFRLASLDGRQIGPPDFLGQVVVIDIWASWCGPCVMQARYLDELQEQFAGAGVQILALNAGEDEQTVRDYVAKTPFAYPVLMDPSDSISVQYQIMGLPTVMVINREGKVTFMRTGVTTTEALAQEVIKAGAAVPASTV